MEKIIDRKSRNAMSGAEHHAWAGLAFIFGISKEYRW